jgi:hypothetical protein
MKLRSIATGLILTLSIREGTPLLACTDENFDVPASR